MFFTPCVQTNMCSLCVMICSILPCNNTYFIGKLINFRKDFNTFPCKIFFISMNPLFMVINKLALSSTWTWDLSILILIKDSSHTMSLIPFYFISHVVMQPMTQLLYQLITLILNINLKASLCYKIGELFVLTTSLDMFCFFEFPLS